MKASQLPWWGWVLVVLGALTVLDALDGGLLPLIIMGVIGWKLFGNQLSRGGGPWGRVPPGGPPGAGGAPPTDRPATGPPIAGPGPGRSDRPSGTPAMPTIDVPRYPGPSGAAGGHPSAVGSGTGGGTDPARSLLRLQLAQAGRDLEQALAAGDAGRARQLLEGMDRLLGASGLADERSRGPFAPSRGSGHDGEERALHGDVRAALSALARGGSGVDRHVLDRVVGRCRAMGQTGHHE